MFKKSAVIRSADHERVGAAARRSAPLCAVLCLVLLLPCCRPSNGAGGTNQGNDLERMERARVTLAGQAIDVWVARTEAEQQAGLMFVNQQQMAALEDGTQRGMLFVFERERLLGFWMSNTIIPLDIAYAKTDGTIVKSHTMVPLDLNTYPSGKPARLALEVSAGLLASLNVKDGDRIELPPQILAPGP